MHRSYRRLPENELDTDCYNAHCRADDARKPRRWSHLARRYISGYKEAYNCDGRINPGRSRDRSNADDATGAIGATDIRPPDGSDGILHRYRSKVCLVGISA